MFARFSLFAIVAALGSIGKAFHIPESPHVLILVQITGTMNVLAQTTCQGVYIVQAGDNCFNIAAEFGVTTAALIAANPVSSLLTSIHVH